MKTNFCNASRQYPNWNDERCANAMICIFDRCFNVIGIIFWYGWIEKVSLINNWIRIKWIILNFCKTGWCILKSWRFHCLEINLRLVIIRLYKYKAIFFFNPRLKFNFSTLNLDSLFFYLLISRETFLISIELSRFATITTNQRWMRVNNCCN